MRLVPKGALARAVAPRFVTEAARQGAVAALRPVGETQFAEVWCLQKWAEAVGQEVWPSWVGRLGLGALHEASPPSSDDAVTWSFALAWHLATGPREPLAELARRHQATFNRATGVHCPPGLRPFQRRVREVTRVTDGDVESAVAALLASDMPVTYLAVAEALGVSPDRIARNAPLRAAVDHAAPAAVARWCEAMRTKLATSRDRLVAKRQRLSRANLADDAGVSLEAIARFERETGETFAVSPSEEYEKLVAGAVDALRAKGQRVTTAAVARELGRERSFIEKRPELKVRIDAARTAKPSAEDVRRACQGLRERDENITVMAVARMLGRGRAVIERDPLLRQLVRDEFEVPLEQERNEVREAVKAVGARGETVSIAAVCRELGWNRGYVARHWDLRKIIEQAR